MHPITLLAFGSRGDVQPFVALAYGLKQAGLPTCLVSNEDFAPLAAQYGLELRPVRANVRQLLETDKGQRMLKTNSLLHSIRYFRQEVSRYMEQLSAEVWEHTRDSQLLVYSLISLMGQDISEKLGIPAISSLLIPSIPTRAFPAPQGTLPNLGGALNYFTHRALIQLVWWMYLPMTNRFRKDKLGLNSLGWNIPAYLLKPVFPLLCPWSQALVPLPKDYPAQARVTGFWFLPTPIGWQPPTELERFLERGDAPVYIGFGSMADRQAERTTQIVLEAIRLSGKRAILQRGWGGLETGNYEDKQVYFLKESVPHDWLFERAAAIVHHGGAGTTAAGLRAGKPAVIIPHFADQFFWAQRVSAQSAGPAGLPFRRLSAPNLAERICTALGDPRITAGAARLGAQIKAEAGASKAVEVIRQYV